MKHVNYTKLTPQERREIRLQYIEEQKGMCMYCKQPLDKEPIKDRSINLRLFPDNFMKYPIHLQHNHNTNMTEGAVHTYCNAVLWQYEHR